METRPRRPKPPRPPLTWRRLFHWGIVFWLLLWMESIFFTQDADAIMKGGHFFKVQIGNGAVTCGQHGGWITFPSGVRFNHREIWSPQQLKLIREYPEILVAKLGGIGLRRTNSGTMLAFPFAGFLWLWLAAGLIGEIRLIKHPALMPEGALAANVGSRKRIAALGGAILALSVVIAVADRMSRRAEEAKICAVHIDRVRVIARGTAVGMPIPWEKHIGPGKGLADGVWQCPSGDAYQFSVLRPPAGKDAVRCPHEDHRRYFAGLLGP